MKKSLLRFCIQVFLILCCINAKSQAHVDSAAENKFQPHGDLSISIFGDYAYKIHADTVNGGRGTAQYSKLQKGQNFFQFRRIYIGYHYEISARYSVDLLLAAEDDIAGGDLLVNNKFTTYIKRANIRWKNLWKGTDIIFGYVSTPAFSFLAEPIWGYRSIEKTIADVRRTPAFDLGVTLQGHFSANDNYGYNIMAGNGQGAKPENDLYKWFYADVYAKFFDKKLILDLYSDYNRMNWNSDWQHSRNMIKGFIAYTVPKITIGAEGFINNLKGDNVATKINGTKDTLTTKAKAISLFAHGKIYKDKLGFFARYDNYDPSENINNNIYISNNPATPQYDPNTKEDFITAGLDYTPDKSVHIMPNIWYNGYRNAGAKNYGIANKDYDLVLRLTCHWLFNLPK